MTSFPPPLPPSATARPPRNWWQRNWRWFIPAVLIVCAILFGSFAAGVIALVKSSGAYKGALVRAQESDAVRAEIGEGIEDGWWVLGNVQTGTHGGNANLRFPIRGSKGNAVVHVISTKSTGDWVYHSLFVVPGDSRRQIDLTEGKKYEAREAVPGSL